MKYELIVDDEWIYEGDFETCLAMAERYDIDPDEIHTTYIVSEDDFYGRR